MKKILYRILNWLEVVVQSILGFFNEHRGGLLHHKKDFRDDMHTYESEGDGDTFGASNVEKFSRLKFFFDQKFFNICVFASGVLGFSEQCGLRFSVRWAVKVARKNGWLTGNGWSYLRAMGKVATKVGFLPIRFMPDDVTVNNWNEYSEWTERDEELLKLAEKYKVKNYKWIKSREALLDAIQNGYVALTAGKWFSAMNVLTAPGYLLKYLGRYIGGHAYRLTGWSHFTDYIEAPQTFGKNYGNNSKAWLRDPFHPRNQSSIYVLTKLPIELLVEEFKVVYEGFVVKTKDDARCFYIDKGIKRHIPTIESFWEIRNKIGLEKFDELANQDILNKIIKGDDILQL